MGGPGSGRKPTGRRSHVQMKKVNAYRGRSTTSPRINKTMTNKYKFKVNKKGQTFKLSKFGRVGKKQVYPDSSD